MTTGTSQVVVDDALAEQIDRRREGRRIDEEIAAGIRNRDGSRVDGGVDDVSGPGTASDRSKRLPGEYYDPERRETFSRAINNAWRESFEAASAVQVATNKRDFNDAVELRRAFDARDAYLAKLDDYATQMVDRPIGLFFGGIVATALGGAVIAPLAAAAGGASTVGGLLTYGAGGAATNIVANSQFRLAAGGTVTAGTLADDGPFGFAGGIAGPIVGKAVSIVGKAVSGRIFGSAAGSAGVRIATEGPAVAGRGDSVLLNQIREAGGTLPVSRGQFGVQDIAGASRAGGNEVAFFRDRASGQLYIRELGQQMGEIPLNSRLILHTQPGSGFLSVQPSVADRAALSALNQRSSVIVNSEGTFGLRFRSTNGGDGNIRPIGGW